MLFLINCLERFFQSLDDFFSRLVDPFFLFRQKSQFVDMRLSFSLLYVCGQLP